MAKYITVEYFIDTEDERTEYPIGALYPREGYTPSDERVRSFLTGENKKGVALIKPIIELPAKEHSEVAPDVTDKAEELSRDEIKARLTELGISYASKAKTETLLEMLNAAEGL